MKTIGRIEWLSMAGTLGYAISQLYYNGMRIYVNVPYFAELASAQDSDMRMWMIRNTGVILVFGMCAFITTLFMAISFKDVWLTKNEEKQDKKEKKIKGGKQKEVIEPPHEKRVIQFDS